jgi:Protein of unknown function (DUF2946)
MRRRLRNFLPVVLIALAVQILAPIGACWAASIAASDPLQAAAICHDGAATQDQSNDQTDQTGQPRAHDGCCSVCSAADAGGLVETPQTAVSVPYLQPERVIWLDRTPDLLGSRTGSHAQARAPPPLM